MLSILKRAFKKRINTFMETGHSKTLRRLLLENIRRQGLWYGIAVGSMLVVAGMTSASAWIMRDLVNTTVVSKDASRVYQIAIAVAVIFIVKGLASYFQEIFLNKAGNSIIAETQRRIYNRMLHQGVAFFSNTSSSDILLRVTQNAQSARMVVDVVMTSFVRDLFSLIGLIIVMFVQQPFLSLVTAILGPASIFGVRVLMKKVREIMERELASLGMIIQGVQETATGIRVVKSFALEEHMTRRMEGYILDVEKQANSIVRIQAASSPIMETLSGLAIAGVIALSGIWVVKEGHTPGELMSFITALLLAYEPAKRLARTRITLEAGLVGVRSMFDLIDMPIAITEKKDAIDLASGIGEIHFDKVSFSYQDGNPLFKNLDIKFPPGKTTALVGPSGGGKSSIINLILRLYDPTTGAVKIDGHDLRDITFNSLRSRIAYVGQDTFLFAGTIKHNIGLGREGATEEEIIEAAKAANAHDFIMRFQNGYNTDAGENGGKLSGGQKQRIAIARAMLRNAEILILDEATSALDSESEFLIRDALQRLTKDRTTIMIAHRLSTVTSAHNVVVLDSGEIVEQGPPKELLAKDGFYRRLYELQLLPSNDLVEESVQA